MRAWLMQTYNQCRDEILFMLKGNSDICMYKPPIHAAIFVADRRRRRKSGDNRSMYACHRRPPDRRRSSPTES